MTGSLGPGDFFALEAGECLDRLEPLVTRPDGPPVDEFLRATRALRGAALLAHQQPIARAAAGLEALARAWRDGRRPWDAATREQAGQAVDELRGLVRRGDDWTDADTARADRLGRDLEALAGRPGPETGWGGRTSSGELNTGVRAFIAREGALIASALDRAARALQADPAAREPLYSVLRRMQSLRGLAELSELAPLPDILDGLELAVGDLTRLYAPPPGVEQVLDAAAQALTRVSRDVAESGRPTPDSPESRRFTDLLLRAFAAERDVVPIESLYVDGDEHPVRMPAGQPQFGPPGPLGPLELMSHGEHLEQSAGAITATHSITERDLRLYGLVGALRSLAGTGTDPLAKALDRLVTSARTVIADGAAAAEPSRFAELLRSAGGLLRQAAAPEHEASLPGRIDEVATRLEGMAAGPRAVTAAVPSAPSSAAHAPGPIAPLARRAAPPSASPPVEPPAESAEPVVPIERLDYDESPAVPIESLAPDFTPLEAGFSLYAELVAARGLGEASLEALMGRVPAADDGHAPAERSGHPADEAGPIVEITELCYRGRGALERAAEVRTELAARLAQRHDLDALEPLLLELLDLVPLALDNSD